MEVPTRRASLTHELETIRTSIDSGVLFATFNSPPINLIGPELVRDLIDLMDRLEQDKDVRVVVFASADEEFFSAKCIAIGPGTVTRHVGVGPRAYPASFAIPPEMMSCLIQRLLSPITGLRGEPAP
jgi:hypothetical protein